MFCAEANREGVRVEECQKLSRFLEKLSPEAKRSADEYRIKSVDELVIFLISNLNRSKVLKEDDNFHALYLLISKLLLILEKFPDNDIRNLASTTKKCDFKKSELVMRERGKWIDLASRFNFNYLNKLDKYGYFNKNHLPELIDEVLIYLDKESDVTFISTMVSDLIAEFGEDNHSQRLIADLKANPEIVTSATVVDEIRELFEEFFESRGDEVRRSTVDFRSVVDRFSGHTKKFKDSLINHKEKLDSFKESLESKNESFNFKSIFGVTKEMSEHVEVFHENIESSESEIEALTKRLEEIERELEEEREKSETDSLTSVYNRRGILKLANSFEEGFSKKAINYSFVFFKVANLDSIGEDYGRFASDAILSNVGKFLKSSCKNTSHVGRYSGSVFMILSTKDESSLRAMLSKLKEKLQNSKFMYENRKIKVDVKMSITARSGFNKQREMFDFTYKNMNSKTK